MSAGLSPADVAAARYRFGQDQDDAQFVEYTYAMERIGRSRRWRRARRRLLRARGIELGPDVGPDLDGPVWIL